MNSEVVDPFSPKDYKERKVFSVKDEVLLEFDIALLSLQEALGDLSEEEYLWEPIPEGERSADLVLPPEKKKVWRVFEDTENKWTYDYALGDFNPPPFTTIAWILNHIAQTADMYLRCIKTGKQEGNETKWEDLPVFGTFSEMRQYVFQSVLNAKNYVSDIPDEDFATEYNKFTPAPWGERLPTYDNLHGGIIDHAKEHATQISMLKYRIRYRY